MADPRVYVKFDQVNWTEITDYVTAMDMNIGRSYEQDEFEPGTLSLTLDNYDGRFTPGLSTGAYYPNVKPRRPVKVERTVNGTLVSMFTGVIERWPVTLSNNGASVTVTALDNMSVATRVSLKRYAVEWFRKFKPLHYYPLANTDISPNAQDWGYSSSPVIGTTVSNKYGGAGNVGSTRVTDIGEGTVASSYEVTSTGYVPRGAGAAMQFVSGEDFGTWYQIGFLFNVTSLTLNGGFSSGTLYQDFYPDGSLAARVTIEPVAVFPATNGTVTVTWYKPDGTVNSTASAAIGGITLRNAVVGDKYFIMAEFNRTAGVAKISLFSKAGSNYYLTAGNGGVGSSTLPTVRKMLEIGQATAPGGVSPAPGASGILGRWSNLFVASQSMASTAVSGIPSVFATATTTVAISSVLSEITSLAGLTLSTNVVYNGDSINRPDWDDDTLYLDVMKSVTESINAELYADRAGNIVVQNRQTRLNPVSAVTFDQSGATQVEAGLLFEADDERIINDVTVDYFGGSVRSTNDASVTEFQRGSLSRTTILSSGDQAKNLADWLVYLGRDSLVRCDTATIETGTVSAAFSLSLHQLFVDSCITLTNLPPQAPASSMSFFVEGVDWSFTIGGETLDESLTLQLSPVTKYQAWTIEDPTYGFIDGSSVIVY